MPYSPATAEIRGVTQVVAFGDSYLDSGALLRLSTAAVAAKVPNAKVLPAPIDDPVYAPGRWSDGPSMVEVMAGELGLGLTNYAIGGAKATFGNYHAWLDYYADTGLAGQIDGFEVSLRGGHADPDAIYVVAAGANDYFQFHDFRQPGVVALQDGPRLSYAAVAGRAARGVVHAASRLAALGARRLLVFTAYALDATPWATSSEPQVEPAQSFTGAFDVALQLEFERVRAQGSDARLFPVGARMRTILADAASYGIADVHAACQPVLPVPGPRRGPGASYFWWDECHPTARVHELLGHALADVVRGRS